MSRSQNSTASRDSKLIQSAFNALDSKGANYKQKFLEYERIYNSKHLKELLDNAKETNRSALFIPTAYTTVEIAMSVFSSAFFSNGMPIEISGVGDSDKEKAAVLTTLAKHYYKKDRPQARLEKAFLQAGIFGLGSVKTFWNSDRDQPATRHKHVMDIAFDPEAEDIEDIGYCCDRFKQTNTVIAQKIKSNFYKPKKKIVDLLGNDYKNTPYKRNPIHEIYHYNSDGTFTCRTYINKTDILREASFMQNPFKYGHLLHKLPCIEDSERKEEVAVYGDSLIRIILPLVEEINATRNKKSDLIEKKIADEHFIPSTSGINVNDMSKIGHKRCTRTDGIVRVGTADTYDLTQDDMIHKRDLEEASAINGIMRGATSSSDRRSGTSLAMVSANSSLRLEGMIRLLHDTLFLRWAEDWIKLVYLNAPDELILRLTERADNPLGRYGERSIDTDIDFSVNFGISTNKQMMVQSIMSTMQMLQPTGADIMPLLKEMVRLLLGENTNVERIFANVGVGGDGEVSETDGTGAGEDTSLTPSSGKGERGSEVDSVHQGDESREHLARLASNQI